MTPENSPTFDGFPEVQATLSDLEPGAGQRDPYARRQAALLAFGRRAAVSPPLAVLMQDAGALVAEVLGADLSGVGELYGDGKRLAMRIVATDRQGRVVDGVNHLYSLETEGSMVAYAINTASPVVASDLAAERRFTDLFLRKRGVVAALCIPLHFGGRPFGALGVYRKAKREFTPDEVQFAETISHLLTSSIAHAKAERQLEEQRTYVAAVLDSTEALVLQLDVEGNVLQMNQTCRRVTGFSDAAVRGKPFYSVFIVPEEHDRIRGMLARCRREHKPLRFDSFLLTHDGVRRRVAWSLQTVSDPNADTRFLTLSGIDRTRETKVEAELEHVKKIAEKATTALEALRSSPHSGDEAEDALVRGPAGEQIEQLSTEGVAPLRPFQPLVGKSGPERRTSPRRVYNYRQRIAPIFDGQLPTPDDFYDVACRDISAGGFAFVFDRPPEFESLVVELGSGESASRLAAQVMRVRPLTEEGEEGYLVGCRFTGRISADH